MTAEGTLRRALSAQLAEKCSRHHLVVWDDPDRHYEEVVETVVPEGWNLERYGGSWWDLRRRVEPGFSGPVPPKLVVYVPAPPPSVDPLEEVRQAAGGFKRLLATLLKDALGGEVGASRLSELTARCSTLLAVEETLAGGSDLDSVVVAATGAHDAEGALAAVLVGALAPDLVAQAAPLLAELALRHLGTAVDASDTAGIRSALARHLVLAMVAGAAGDGPVSSLTGSWRPLTSAQARTAHDVVERASHPETFARWGELADHASAELRLSELEWFDGLEDCDVARAVDELAYHEAARRLAGDPGAALALAATRMDRSRWLRWRDGWSSRALADLAAVRAIARFRSALAEHPVPDGATLDAVYHWYAAAGWKVDRCQRLMEGARFGLARPGLDRAYTDARLDYLAWLDQLLDVTNQAVTRDGEVKMLRQSQVWSGHVDGPGGVALIIVDAMRLEIGHRLAEVLGGVAARVTVTCAVAAPPTITMVGMANLLPEAGAEGLDVGLEAGAVTVRVGGRPVRTVADRTAAYRKAAGRVEDHSLSDWLSLGDDMLAERAGADLLVVRSQEIDAAGTHGLATVRWSQIDATVDALAILVSRLAACGVRRAVVTADHGFLALGRPLDASRVRPAPTGPGCVEHGRAWIGRPAAVPDGCTAVALADFGVRSEEQIVVPDGMTVFGASGESFFHGGISPQEALVPVIDVDLERASKRASELPGVAVEVPGGRVSAEAFSVRVTLAGSLFATETAVRVTALSATGDTVARLVPGEAVDPATGTVRLDPSVDATLTFLVSGNLDKGDAVEVAVIDAATGRPLARTRATVARALRPEEEW